MKTILCAAIASGHQLGPVRRVSMLMRSHDGEDAMVSVAVRFAFADQPRGLKIKLKM